MSYFNHFLRIEYRFYLCYPYMCIYNPKPSKYMHKICLCTCKISCDFKHLFLFFFHLYICLILLFKLVRTLNIIFIVLIIKYVGSIYILYLYFIKNRCCFVKFYFRYIYLSFYRLKICIQSECHNSGKKYYSYKCTYIIFSICHCHNHHKHSKYRC